MRSLDPAAAWKLMKVTGHVLRGLLLVTSLAGAGIWLVWSFAPHSVENVDAELKRRYRQPHEERLQLARQQLSTDPGQGIVSLKTFLADFEEVRKGDRLADLKYTAFETLAKTYDREGSWQALLELSAAWQTFDAKDLRARRYQAQALLSLPGRKGEAVVHLEELHQMVPQLAADLYGPLLLEQGRGYEYFRNFQTQIKAFQEQVTHHWEVFWDTGQGFNAAQRTAAQARWIGPFQLRVTASLPAGSYQQLRVDAPPGLPMFLVDPRLGWGDDSQNLVLTTLTLGLHDMEVTGNRMKASGSDPFFEARPRETLVKQDVFTVTLHALALPASVEPLASLLADPPQREALLARLAHEKIQSAFSLLADLEPHLGPWTQGANPNRQGQGK